MDDSLFRIGGIASGIDFNKVIDQLMAIERRPVYVLQDSKQLLSWKKDFWSDLQTSLNTLNTSVGALLQKSTMAARTTSSTDTTTVTADATSAAAIGSYSVNITSLATSTKATSGTGGGLGIGGAMDPTQPISSIASKLNKFVTSGTFTINGVTFALSDTNSDSNVDQVVVTNSSGTTKTFNGSGSGGNLTLNDMITTVINDATVSGWTGVTATPYSSATDKLTLNGSTINLGSGGDTSNFLSAMGLLNAPLSGTTKTSTFHLGTLNTSQMLSTANFATAITGDSNGNGSFTINGVTISYNKSTDTVQNVIDRINSSAAGVNASFDSLNDKLVLTNKSTGSLSITRSDGSSSNFLTATNLLTSGVHAGTDTIGANAVFSINGGSNLTSLTNDVSGVITGVTFHLLKSGTTPAPTITVSGDTATAKAAIKDFIDKYNAAITLINTKLNEQPVKDPKSILDKKVGLLSGDNQLANMKYDLVYKATTIVTGLSTTLNRLDQMGITIDSTNFGKAGTLVLKDESKLNAALSSNMGGVASVFFNDLNGNGKVDTGEDGVAARLSTYLNQLVGVAGTRITNRTEDTDPAITYSGTWSVVADLNATAGGYKQSTNSGNYASFTFYGDTITWYATKTSSMGTAEVFIDGVDKGSVNLNSSTGNQYQQAVYTASGLSTGSHTIKIQQTTASPVNIDALDATQTNGNGDVLNRQSTLTDQMTTIDKQVDKWNQRLDMRQQTLIRQFTAMELAISKLQQMQGSFAAQLGALSGK